MAKKLCKDQREGLIAKLTAFFNGLNGEDIDDVVAEAKKQVSAESTEERKKNFIQLFDGQMATLKDRGCPQAILEAFQSKKDAVIAKAIQTSIAEGNIPFLPVIPRSYMGIYALMPMVRHEDKIGYTYLDPNLISDVVETPKTPYFVLDVEDGQAMLGKTVNEASKLIEKQKRLILTDPEVISIGIHSDVLSRHNVDAAGSRYGTGSAPNLYLSGGKPKLSYNDVSLSDGKGGSASCGSRV